MKKELREIIRRPWSIPSLSYICLAFTVLLTIVLDIAPLGKALAFKVIMGCSVWLSCLAAHCMWRETKDDNSAEGRFWPNYLAAVACNAVAATIIILSMNDEGNTVMGARAVNAVPVYYAITIVSTAAWLRGRFRARRFRRIMAQRRAGHTGSPGKHQV